MRKELSDLVDEMQALINAGLPVITRPEVAFKKLEADRVAELPNDQKQKENQK